MRSKRSVSAPPPPPAAVAVECGVLDSVVSGVVWGRFCRNVAAGACALRRACRQSIPRSQFVVGGTLLVPAAINAATRLAEMSQGFVH